MVIINQKSPEDIVREETGALMWRVIALRAENEELRAKLSAPTAPTPKSAKAD